MEIEQKMSPYEAYQEARKISKFLRAFENFEQLLKPLAEHEAILKQSRADLSQTQKDSDALMKTLETLNASIKAARVELANLQTKNIVLTQEGAKHYNTKIAETNTAIETLKQTAQEELKSITGQVEQERQILSNLRRDKMNLEEQLGILKQKWDSQVKQIMQSFGDK